MNFLKNYPLPISGMFLSMLTLGNILQVYSSFIKIVIGIFITFFYFMYLIKIFIFRKDVISNFNNSLVASSFPVIAMASVVYSSYVKFLSEEFANFLWYGAVIFYAIYIPYFSYKFLRNFEIEKVFASWYIVYVGPAIIGIFSKISGNYFIGKASFYFGFINFLVLLPIICYRVIKYRSLSDIQRPSLIVLAAPASLLFLSYYFSFAEKNYKMIVFLFCCSLIFYLLSLIFLPRIIKQDFQPTISAITFPMVTGAYVSKIMTELFVNYSFIFSFLYFVQLIIANFVVVFALGSYIKFFVKQIKN